MSQWDPPSRAGQVLSRFAFHDSDLLVGEVVEAVDDPVDEIVGEGNLPLDGGALVASERLHRSVFASKRGTPAARSFFCVVRACSRRGSCRPRRSPR